MSRATTFDQIVELCGGDLTPVDRRKGWPTTADLKTTEGIIPIAAHVGPIGTSHRGRDDVERRFQNPGPSRPVIEVSGRQSLLLGLWEEVGRPVLVGMDANRRVGKMTRFSLFIPLATLHQAEAEGWAEHHSTSGEHIIAFRPDLLSTYVEFCAPGHGLETPDILSALAASGFAHSDEETPEQRARRATSCLIRDSRFGRDVAAAYDGLCAMCGLRFVIEGAHIYPASAPSSTDDLWNGVALCSNHHRALDRHLIWIAPETRELRVHPSVEEGGEVNEACRQFVKTMRPHLSDPVDSKARPRSEMFKKRYDYYGDRYDWAAP